MPKIGGDHKKLHGYFQEVIDSGHFTEGKFVRRFEEMVSVFYGGYAVAVNSCGSGLFATMRTLDFTRFSSVAVPNNTFMATASMTYECVNAESVVSFVDCNRTDFSMDAETFYSLDQQLEFGAAVYTLVGGAIPVDYAHIAAYCDENEVVLIEDRAHAFGISVPILGQAAVFSLYPTKAIPAGEGGVIVVNDPSFAEELKEFRNYGKYKDPSLVLRHRTDRGAFNLRMDEWTAAVAVYQMERLDEILELREEAAHQLMKVVEPLWEPPVGHRNWYKYIVPSDFPTQRVVGQVYGRTDQLDSVYAGSPSNVLPCENSAWVARNHICLPIDESLYAGMSAGMIEEWLLGGKK